MSTLRLVMDEYGSVYRDEAQSVRIGELVAREDGSGLSDLTIDMPEDWILPET